MSWDGLSLIHISFNGLMMIPNLIGVLALSGTVVDITRNYFARRVRGEDIEPMWSCLLYTSGQLEALFAMTPYYWKTPRDGAARLAALPELTTDISFRFLVFEKK